MGLEVGEGGTGEKEKEKVKIPLVRHKSSTPWGQLPSSPFNFKHNLLRQGTGTADHLTLFGQRPQRGR